MGRARFCAHVSAFGRLLRSSVCAESPGFQALPLFASPIFPRSPLVPTSVRCAIGLPGGVHVTSDVQNEARCDKRASVVPSFRVFPSPCILLALPLVSLQARTGRSHRRCILAARSRWRRILSGLVGE